MHARRGARRGCPTSNRNRSIEAHLANHGIDQFYGAGRPDDDPFGAEHTRDTRLRVLRVDRMNGGPLAAWINSPSTSRRRRPTWTSGTPTSPARPPIHLVTRSRAPGFVALYTNGALGRPDAALRLVQPHRGDGPARPADRRRRRARLAGGGQAPDARRAGRRALDARLLLRAGGRARPARRRQPGLGPAVPRRLRGRRVDLPRAAGDRGQAAAGGARRPRARAQDHRRARARARDRPRGPGDPGRRPAAARRSRRAERRDGPALPARPSRPCCRAGVKEPVRRRPRQRLHGLPDDARGVRDAALRGRAHRLRQPRHRCWR